MAYPFPFWARLLGDLYTVEFCANLCISSYRDILEIAKCYEACVKARGGLPGKDVVRVSGNRIKEIEYINYHAHVELLLIKRVQPIRRSLYEEHNHIDRIDVILSSLVDKELAEHHTISDDVLPITASVYTLFMYPPERHSHSDSVSARQALVYPSSVSEQHNTSDSISVRAIHRSVLSIEEAHRHPDVSFYRLPGAGGITPYRVIALEYIDPYLSESITAISDEGADIKKSFSYTHLHHDILRVIPADITPRYAEEEHTHEDMLKLYAILYGDVVPPELARYEVLIAPIPPYPSITSDIAYSDTRYDLAITEQPWYTTYQEYVKTSVLGYPAATMLSPPATVLNEDMAYSFTRYPASIASIPTATMLNTDSVYVNTSYLIARAQIG